MNRQIAARRNVVVMRARLLGRAQPFGLAGPVEPRGRDISAWRFQERPKIEPAVRNVHHFDADQIVIAGRDELTSLPSRETE